MRWRLSRIQYPVYNLGPGRRIGIWVQGCTLRCPGCISRSLWRPDGGRDVDLQLLCGQILRVKDHFDGVTITGGEPFDQYEPLILFCAYVRRRTGLSLYVFSGYRLEELVERHPDRTFMKVIDYLLDGRYVRELHGNENGRGSSNQRLYAFHDGVAQERMELFESRKWSVSVSPGGDLHMAGIPRKGDLSRLRAGLRQKGITLKFG